MKKLVIYLLLLLAAFFGSVYLPLVRDYFSVRRVAKTIAVAAQENAGNVSELLMDELTTRLREQDGIQVWTSDIDIYEKDGSFRASIDVTFTVSFPLIGRAQDHAVTVDSDAGWTAVRQENETEDGE